jgi:ribose 5-phosphate isomerase A
MLDINTSNPKEQQKLLAAQAALEFVKNDMALGLGSGSTISFFIQSLGRRLATRELRGVSVVPTSLMSAQMAAEYAIPIIRLAKVAELDLAIDGADEIDPQLNLIKGMGGALLREKIVAMHAREFIVIADESKLVDRLGTQSPLPVEIIPFEAEVHIRWLNTLGLKAELMLNADRSPYTTDNGNYIALCSFKHREPAGIPDAYRLALEIKGRAGIVEHGLFLDMASRVLVATPRGVRILEQER